MITRRRQTWWIMLDRRFHTVGHLLMSPRTAQSGMLHSQMEDHEAVLMLEYLLITMICKWRNVAWKVYALRTVLTDMIWCLTVLLLDRRDEPRRLQWMVPRCTRSAVRQTCIDVASLLQELHLDHHTKLTRVWSVLWRLHHETTHTLRQCRSLQVASTVSVPLEGSLQAAFLQIPKVLILPTSITCRWHQVLADQSHVRADISADLQTQDRQQREDPLRTQVAWSCQRCHECTARFYVNAARRNQRSLILKKS